MIDAASPMPSSAEHLLRLLTLEADALAGRLRAMIEDREPALAIMALRRAFVRVMLDGAATPVERQACALAALGEVCLEIEAQMPGMLGEGLHDISAAIEARDAELEAADAQA